MLLIVQCYAPPSLRTSEIAKAKLRSARPALYCPSTLSPRLSRAAALLSATFTPPPAPLFPLRLASPRSPHRPHSAAAVMNRYKILKTIGDGTYGSVLKGQEQGREKRSGEPECRSERGVVESARWSRAEQSRE